MKRWSLLWVLCLAACLLCACAAPAEPAASPPASSVPAVSAPAEPAEPALSAQAALYLQVLQDLWAVDSGLNSDLALLGVDLSATALPEAEQHAVAAAFAADHDLTYVEGTWKDLGEAGYIDMENLVWEDGCHFSITERADGTFDAQKWRSGLGAYFFSACTQREEQGVLTYTIGAEAIA